MGSNSCFAKTYAAQNVPVFPCHANGPKAKSPCTTHGFKDASSDPNQLNLWAGSHPDALYGIACRTNSLIVLDADRHGNGDGVAEILSLFEFYNADPLSTACVRTPNDGLHILFRRPETLGRTRGRISECIDIRDNAYVIAAGMSLQDGREYRLLNGTVEQLASAIGDRSLPLLPQWLLPYVIQPPFVREQQQPRADPAALITRQLRGFARAIIFARSGNRNNVLFWAACRTKALIDSKCIDEDAALALLVAAAQQAGLGDNEARATALSGLRQARGVPDGR